MRKNSNFITAKTETRMVTWWVITDIPSPSVWKTIAFWSEIKGSACWKEKFCWRSKEAGRGYHLPLFILRILKWSYFLTKSSISASWKNPQPWPHPAFLQSCTVASCTSSICCHFSFCLLHLTPQFFNFKTYRNVALFLNTSLHSYVFIALSLV